MPIPPLAPFSAGVVPSGETSVSMVSERGSIRLEPTEDAGPSECYLHATCLVTAQFELLSDRDEVLVVGHPIGPIVSGVPGEWITPDRIHVSVDGQSVELEVRTAFGPAAGTEGER